MKIDRYLNKWLAAGLIDAQTHQRLMAHEAQADRPWVMYTVVALGGLAIAMGLLMVIGANWDDIPAIAKLIVYGALGCGLSAGFLKVSSGRSWLNDLLVGLILTWSLGGFALVSQVYQMGGSMAHAVTVWLIITAPIMLLGTGRFLNTAWLLCIAAGWYLWLPLLNIEDVWFFIGWILAPGFIFLAIGHLHGLQVRRAGLVIGSTSLGLLSILAAANVLSFHVVVQGLVKNQAMDIGSLLMVLCLSLIVCTPVILNWRKHLDAQRYKGQLRLLIAALTAIFGVSIFAVLVEPNPGRFDFDSWSITRLGSIASYIFFWLSAASWAMSIGSVWLNTIAVLAIAFRLLMIFITTFSSLLGTGLIFILAGVCAIGISVIIYRRHTRLSNVLTGQHHP